MVKFIVENEEMSKDNVVIFGAQGIALGAYQAFHNLYPQKKVRCFLVSKIKNNPYTLEGIPVRELVSFASDLSYEEKKRTEILIATPENLMEDIENNLKEYGFHNYVRLTSSRWSQLMGYHYICSRKYMPLSALPVGCHETNIYMFMAKFYRDKPLAAAYDISKPIIPIQVGAALCKERIADVLDCDGENISVKNVNYSELTALYWIWKNRLSNPLLLNQNDYTNTEYYGLCHYRRILELSEDDQLRLKNNHIDVVLPYPMPYEPNIEEHHKKYLSNTDWKALLTALKELQPNYADAFPLILCQQYFYNYNIILARKEVLCDYCKWLFPILERVEQLSVPRGWERKDRYIGYMGETLETLYFMYNQNRLTIVYTGCKFLM